ncbi:hypothetical protein OIU76_003801, partial [Salix suchowensis]
MRKSSRKMVSSVRCCDETRLRSNSRKLASVMCRTKKITEQESRVGALLKEPLVQDLL